MWNPHTRFNPIVGLGISLFLLLAVYSVVVAQTWSELFPSGTPPLPRWSAGTAYDSSTDRLILFSGEDNSGVHPHAADVWILTPATGGGTPSWVQLFPVGSAPPGRHLGAVAYDPINNRLIVHGGCLIHCTPVLNDAWVLTNANGLGGMPSWIALPSAPIARSGNVAAYDPESNRMIIFGGATGFPGTDRNDVWVLTNANGIGASTWAQLFPTGGPPPVRGETASGVYDPASNRLIIFGGSTTTGVHYNDVWVLSHANGLGGTPQWTQLSPLGTLPAVRNGHALLYDAASNRLIVFGGSNTTGFLNDVWVLTEANGTGGTPTWTMLTPTGGPPIERTFASAGYASASNRLVVALGRNDTEPQGLVDDVWLLSNANGIGALEMAIDIKPGSFPNSINPRSQGVIPVALLTTDTFDATTIDPLSVEFGPNGATEAHGKGHIEDVDRDGDLDLVLHFNTQDTGIRCGDTSAALTGETVDGQEIQGSDSIRTVGCK